MQGGSQACKNEQISRFSYRVYVNDLGTMKPIWSHMKDPARTHSIMMQWSIFFIAHACFYKKILLLESTDHQLQLFLYQDSSYTFIWLTFFVWISYKLWRWLICEKEKNSLMWAGSDYTVAIHYYTCNISTAFWPHLFKFLQHDMTKLISTSQFCWFWHHPLSKWLNSHFWWQQNQCPMNLTMNSVTLRLHHSMHNQPTLLENIPTDTLTLS